MQTRHSLLKVGVWGVLITTVSITPFVLDGCTSLFRLSLSVYTPLCSLLKLYILWRSSRTFPLRPSLWMYTPSRSLLLDYFSSHSSRPSYCRLRDDHYQCTTAVDLFAVNSPCAHSIRATRMYCVLPTFFNTGT